MAFFRCRAFLGCMSLKTGVWLLALLAMMVSGPGAAGSWLEVVWMKDHPLTLYGKLTIIIQAAAFSSLFLISILGFIAALQGARGAVYIYSKFIFIHGALILLSLGLTLFGTLTPEKSNPDVEKCVNGSTSTVIVEFCKQRLSIAHILSIALIGAALAIQFYAWIVASSYGEDLDTTSAVDKYFRSETYSDHEARPLSAAYPEAPFARVRR
ncbi:hypothetical protein B0H15DRAFT_371532 [Mycena belliarum]|uniref:Tetraspanin n=1 Tax=Mycena belliarum TaxID=1033014 RepID=A0AAD6U0M8_9AGAR|nr:hypothetical protein B0H15DRAFT_371532 [Mycena belliae]